MSGLEGLHDGDDRGGLDPVTLPASDLEGEPVAVDQQAHDDLGIDPPLLASNPPAAGHPHARPRSRAWSRLQAQGQPPGGGDVLEQGLRDRLPIAPLHAVSQGAEQGPHADRVQA